MLNRNRQIAQIFIATDVSQKLRSTLEFGVVIAIIMLLVALAARSYETYVVRAQLSEALFLTSAIRGDLIVDRAQSGEWPETLTGFRVSTRGPNETYGKYVDHIALGEHGSFSAIFVEANDVSALAGRQLTFRPMLVSSSRGAPVIWRCANGRVPAGFASNGLDKTDIDVKHLPSACRDY